MMMRKGMPLIMTMKRNVWLSKLINSVNNVSYSDKKELAMMSFSEIINSQNKRNSFYKRKLVSMIRLLRKTQLALEKWGMKRLSAENSTF